MSLSKVVRHIEWYVRKVADHTSVRPAKRSEKWYRRAKRLQQYKVALNQYCERVS